MKGGLTMETSKYWLSWKRNNIGVILSVKGIPYFEIDFVSVRGGFEPNRSFCCLVAECDQMDEQLNIDRTWYKEGKVSESFEEAVRKILHRFTQQDTYKAYLSGREKERKRESAEDLNARKDALMAPNQLFVYFEGAEEFIHKEPENEGDTLALLLKLEGMGKLPFKKFKTIDYSSTSGIDIIGEIQEKEDDEIHKFVAVEVEHIFERFLLHRHVPTQTRYIFCWKIRRPEELQPTSDPYKFKKEISEQTLEVFEISKFPGLRIRRR